MSRVTPRSGRRDSGDGLLDSPLVVRRPSSAVGGIVTGAEVYTPEGYSGIVSTVDGSSVTVDVPLIGTKTYNCDDLRLEDDPVLSDAVSHSEHGSVTAEHDTESAVEIDEDAGAADVLKAMHAQKMLAPSLFVLLGTALPGTARLAHTMAHLTRTQKREMLRLRLFEVLENGSPYPGTAEVGVLYVVLFIIFLSVGAIIVETLQEKADAVVVILQVIEYVAAIVFTVEFVLRFWAAPADSSLRTDVQPYEPDEVKRMRREMKEKIGRFTPSWRMRMRWLLRILTLLDIGAILPFYVSVATDSELLSNTTLLRMFRLARLFKFSRYSSAMDILMTAYRLKKDELWTTMLFNLGLLVFSSSVLFFVESPVQPDAFSSIPTSMWWGVATLTTVGYGDIAPKTPVGRLLGAIVAFFGIGFFALPAGIISSAFIEINQREMDRQRVTLQRMQFILRRMQKRDLGGAFLQWKLALLAPSERGRRMSWVGAAAVASEDHRRQSITPDKPEMLKAVELATQHSQAVSERVGVLESKMRTMDSKLDRLLELLGEADVGKGAKK